MKKKTSQNLIEIYCLSYFIKYLRCIIIEAQMEKVALNNFKLKKSFASSALVKLNLKHNRLVKSLYDQKIKIEDCA